MNMPKDLLKTQEVAELLGVGPTAVKRWADEGLLPCIKTAGGHRRIRRIDAENFRKGGNAVSPSTPVESSTPSHEMDPWLKALIADDSAYVLEGLLLSERGKRGSWAAVADFLGLILKEVGDRWSRGEWTVLQEHLASERLVRALLKAEETIDISPQAPWALLVSPDGEDHTLGLSLLEIVLKESGWRSIWAGRRAPLNEVTNLIGEGKLGLVASSATAYLTDEKELAAWLLKVTEVCRKAGVRLMVGGRGAWPENPSYAERVNSFEEVREKLLFKRS